MIESDIESQSVNHKDSNAAGYEDSRNCAQALHEFLQANPDVEPTQSTYEDSEGNIELEKAASHKTERLSFDVEEESIESQSERNNNSSRSTDSKPRCSRELCEGACCLLVIGLVVLIFAGVALLWPSIVLGETVHRQHHWNEAPGTVEAHHKKSDPGFKIDRYTTQFSFEIPSGQKYVFM